MLTSFQTGCGDDSSGEGDTDKTVVDSGGGGTTTEETSTTEPDSDSDNSSESDTGQANSDTTASSAEDAGGTTGDSSTEDAGEQVNTDADGGVSDGGLLVDGGGDVTGADADVAAADAATSSEPDAATDDASAGGSACGGPVLIGSYQPPSGNPEGFAVDGERLYLASTSAGVYVVDISDQTEPTEIGQYDFPAGTLAFRVAAQGDLVAVALRGNGWALLDVSDVENISMPSSDDSVGAEDVGLNGDTLFYADADGLGSVDISDPENPVTLTDDLVLPGASKQLLVAGDLVYVASLGGGISIVDASDPAELTELITIDVGTSGSTHMVLSGSTLYAAEDSGVTIIDVSDPTMPEVLGEYVRERAENLAVMDNHLFVFGTDTTSIDVPFLAVVDVSDPSAPVEENTSLSAFDEPVFGTVVGDTLFATVEDDDSLHLFTACPTD